MKSAIILSAFCGALVLAACSTSSSSVQRHEAACLNDAVTGALLGGVVANQFWQNSRSRRSVGVAGGAMVGAAVNSRYSC